MQTGQLGQILGRMMMIRDVHIYTHIQTYIDLFKIIYLKTSLSQKINDL